MADGFSATQGSGTTIWTDETASGHAQYVKLASGAADSVAVIPGDATNGLYVNLKRRTIRVQVTPTIDTNAFTSGDCIGGIQSITSATSYTGGGGRIIGVQVLDKTQAQRAAMDIYFYSQSVTQAGNNSPFACSDSDQAFLVGAISLGSWSYNTAFPGTPLNSIASWPSPASAATSQQVGCIPYVCAATTLFAQPVVRGTPTYTGASDLIFTYLLEPD